MKTKMLIYALFNIGKWYLILKRYSFESNISTYIVDKATIKIL